MAACHGQTCLGGRCSSACRAGSGGRAGGGARRSRLREREPRLRHPDKTDTAPALGLEAFGRYGRRPPSGGSHRGHQRDECRRHHPRGADGVCVVSPSFPRRTRAPPPRHFARSSKGTSWSLARSGFGFIRRVSRGCLIRSEGVERAIGDDAAAFVVPTRVDAGDDGPAGRASALLGDATTPFNLGQQAMAVNLSDIGHGRDAARGVRSHRYPRGLPRGVPGRVYDGMKRLAARHGVNILGAIRPASGCRSGAQRDVIGHVRRDECCIAPGRTWRRGVRDRTGRRQRAVCISSSVECRRRMRPCAGSSRPISFRGRTRGREVLAATGAATAALDVAMA